MKTRTRVALFGECMLELQGEAFGTLQQTFGGDTLNTAVYLSRCGATRGVQTTYATAVGDDRLSFGSPDRLMARLGLTPGSVSPFGLINDADGSVRVILDRDLRGRERLIFHPNINTASVVVSWADLEKFLATRTNTVRIVDLASHETR